MANIAVEQRRHGIPWWVWVIVALIIAGIIWYFSATGGRNNAANPPATGEASRTTPITDMAVLYNTPNARNYAGETVQAGPVTVLSQAGNGVYWVGQDAAHHVLVVLNPSGATIAQGATTPGTTNTQGSANAPGGNTNAQGNPNPEESTYAQSRTLKAGQMVRVYGTVEPFPGYDQARQRWGVNPDSRTDLSSQQVYVSADRIVVVGGGHQ